MTALRVWAVAKLLVVMEFIGMLHKEGCKVMRASQRELTACWFMYLVGENKGLCLVWLVERT